MSITAPAPPQTDVHNVIAVGGSMTKLTQILRRRGLDPKQAIFEDRPDNTEEYQRDVYRQAWENSLRRAGHSEYIRFGLGDLEPEQYPDHLRKFIDAHVEVRRQQRAQASLPPEERQHFRPKFLNAILPGEVGAGKTVAAVAAGAYAVDQGLMARMVSHSLYLSWLRPDGAPTGMSAAQVLEFYERVDVLVLDELCNEMDSYATEFVRTRTSELITARVNSGRPTLFTTNLNSAQIEEILGARLVSRIGMAAVVLKVTGNDRRRPQSW
ncbi:MULTISPECIES: ATP-binding protein [unclassified Streptomyces]|uniref:ATP-binding protein n=1 Tax=unclassified Streptomyces TaxID=2593676 RepID=UPI00332F0EE9